MLLTAPQNQAAAIQQTLEAQMAERKAARAAALRQVSRCVIHWERCLRVAFALCQLDFMHARLAGTDIQLKAQIFQLARILATAIVCCILGPTSPAHCQLALKASPDFQPKRQ